MQRLEEEEEEEEGERTSEMKALGEI